LGGSGAGGGRVAGSRKDLRYRAVGGLVTQWYWRVTGRRAVVSVVGVELWPVGQWVAMGRCWAFRWRTSSVQRAAWVGVVLLISRSIKERLIIGVGGGTEVGDADGEVGGRVSKVVGLSGWVGVVCWVIIVGSGSVGVVGGGGRFGLSATVLTLGVGSSAKLELPEKHTTRATGNKNDDDGKQPAKNTTLNSGLAKQKIDWAIKESETLLAEGNGNLDVMQPTGMNKRQAYSFEK